MALYDWNQDGKKDFVDDYLEYNIVSVNSSTPPKPPCDAI